MWSLEAFAQFVSEQVEVSVINDSGVSGAREWEIIAMAHDKNHGAFERMGEAGLVKSGRASVADMDEDEVRAANGIAIGEANGFIREIDPGAGAVQARFMSAGRNNFVDLVEKLSLRQRCNNPFHTIWS